MGFVILTKIYAICKTHIRSFPASLRGFVPISLTQTFDYGKDFGKGYQELVWCQVESCKGPSPNGSSVRTEISDTSLEGHLWQGNINVKVCFPMLIIWLSSRTAGSQKWPNAKRPSARTECSDILLKKQFVVRRGEFQWEEVFCCFLFSLWFCSPIAGVIRRSQSKGTLNQ